MIRSISVIPAGAGDSSPTIPRPKRVVLRFARDSLLEGDGFELPVPRSETTISASQRGNGRWRTQEASRAAAPTDPPLRLSRQPKSTKAKLYAVDVFDSVPSGG